MDLFGTQPIDPIPSTVTVRSDADVYDALSGAAYTFDLDIYRLLVRWFDAGTHRSAARVLTPGTH